MSGLAAECHGCLVCHSVKRAFRCAECVNRALSEKRSFSHEAHNRSNLASEQLATSLEERESGQQQQRQLAKAAAARAAAAERAAAAQATLRKVRDAIRELEERIEARRRAVAAADKQLAARRAEALEVYVPDVLRIKRLQLKAVNDHLVDFQRARLLVLQEILPLTLSPMRWEVPAASARGSGFWKRSAPTTRGRPLRPIVAIKELRLPEGLSRIGCDTGQEAQELGSALGYLLLYLELAAAYLGTPLLNQPHFWGSWSTLWQRAGFWRAAPPQPCAVLRLSFAPAAEAAAADGRAPNAAPAAPSQRMPSQPAAHPMEAVSALAQRSARSLWGGVAAGYQAYAGGGGKGASGGSPTGAAHTAAAVALPSEDETRAAEVALGRALHALHRTAGAIVADQLGPGKLRSVPPEWGAFASLAALMCAALHPMYRQGPRARAASQLLAGGASSSLLAPAAPQQPPGAAADSRIAGVSTLFLPPDADGEAEWDMIARPGAAWGGGGEWGGLLPPPPSQPEAVEHWTRALFLDTHAAEQTPPERAASARWALGALQQGAGFLRRELAPHLAAVAARLPTVPALPGSHQASHDGSSPGQQH